MRERLQEQIKNLLKIPGEPEAPFGAPGSVRVFRAGPGFLRYRMLGWSVRQLGALVGILFVLQFFSFDPTGVVGQLEEHMNQNVPLEEWDIPLTFGNLWAAFEMLAIAGFVAQLPFTFLMVYLDYEYRWYILTDRSLRIREGLMRVDERTMTFSNIQNVTVRQGPLQRVLGISDVEVSTAGGGSASGGKQHDSGVGGALQAVPAGRNLHQAYFRGIANPAEIRDAILVHLRGVRGSGLGDPDEALELRAAAAPDASGPDVLQAAFSVLQETRALRQQLIR
jgi:hypothetical protein